jgi:hypothetical protein
MIVEIKDYSFKTGKGVALDPAGNEIEFTYKKLKNEVAIPVGKKAEIKGGIYSPANKRGTSLFYIFKLIEWARSRYNGYISK